MDQLLDGLWGVMNHENLAREPAFASLSPPDPDAASLLDAAQLDNGKIEDGEQLWLNRQLVDAAFRQTTGKPCFRSLNVCFDGVLVSDAGRRFKIRNTRAGGLIATSMRATDIVMDRVWQLETDTFSGTPGFVFAPISRILEPHEDATAAHPEVQRMTANIRTDLDRFSTLEISSLIRHGYCIGRSACRSRPDLFGTSMPSGAPWDPLAQGSEQSTPEVSITTRNNRHAAAPETEQSRELQQSAMRRIWSRLWDFRDWTSFVYVPLLVPIFVLLPYYTAKWYKESQVAQRLIEGIAQSNQDYALMSKLLQEGPMSPFEGATVEEARDLPPPDNKGVQVIADVRVIDLRQTQLGSSQATDNSSLAFVYRRLRVQKMESAANRFVVQFRLPTEHVNLRTLNGRIPSVIRLSRDAAAAGGTPAHLMEVVFDLSKVPERDVVDLPIELMSRELARGNLNSTTFHVNDETGLLSYWLLLPEGRKYQNFELLRYATGETKAPERVAPAYNLNTMGGSVLAFALLSSKPGFVYECRWENLDEG